MSDFLPHADDASDLEGQIQAAGRYVRASENLRPRVLEAARLERFAVHGSSGLAAVCGAGVLIVWLVFLAAQQARVDRSVAADSIEESDVWQLGATVQQQSVAAAGGPPWALVDVIDAVRVRQSELLTSGESPERPVDASMTQ